MRACDRDGPRGWLYSTHTIVTPPIVHEKEFVGIRVTQNVWTTPAEIDVFAATVLNAMKEGIADRSLVYERAFKLFTRAQAGPA